MADDLIAMFNNIRMDDHDTLITQFSNVLGCEATVSHFFLESSNWNVEKALNTFLSSVGTTSNVYAPPPPVAGIFTDIGLISCGQPLPPNTPMMIQLEFGNIGEHAWPHDSMLVHCDGVKMGGPAMYEIGACQPGKRFTLSFEIKTPMSPGGHAGCWRLTCGVGFFSEPLWIMLNVDMNVVYIYEGRMLCQYGMNCKSADNDHYADFCHINHSKEQEFQAWKNSQLTGGNNYNISTTNNATGPLVDAFNSLRVSDTSDGTNMSSNNIDTYNGDENDLL